MGLDNVGQMFADDMASGGAKNIAHKENLLFEMLARGEPCYFALHGTERSFRVEFESTYRAGW